MNYIQLAGQQRPFRYTFRGLRLLSAHLGAATFQELGEKVGGLGLDQVPFLAWVGLKEGAKADGVTFDATHEQVEEWLNDESAGVFTEIMGLFEADFVGDQGEKKATAKGAKK